MGMFTGIYEAINANRINDFGINITEAKKEEIILKINQAFADYATGRYEEIRAGMTRVLGAEKADKMVSEKMEEYASFDLYEKISEVANNFRMWWGKNYRRIHKGKKAKKLIADLDRLIVENGYSTINVFAEWDDLSETAREQKYLAVADLFLQMLDLGYTWDELAR